MTRRLLGLLGIAAAFALAGCRSLDDQKLETELKSEIERQAGVKVKSVSCPENRPIKQGDKFQCTVTTTAGDSAQVDVTQTDDKGNVRWQLRGT